MRFAIEHKLEFSYSRPVFLEPHTVRLCPRTDAWQCLLDFEMTVHPDPQGATKVMDLDGTAADILWFQGTTATLSITASSKVETLKSNPYDFILPGKEFDSLPFTYPDSQLDALQVYRARTETPAVVKDFAESVLKESGRDTLAFPKKLAETIHQSVQVEFREKGEPMPPQQVLKEKKGACRDLSVLFMDVCRAVGLASRFTSGYFFLKDETAKPELHGWAEVYLPGGGWRGFDPTHGLAVSDRHIALASGVHPVLAAPTNGKLRGTGAESKLSYAISIQAGEG